MLKLWCTDPVLPIMYVCSMEVAFDTYEDEHTHKNTRKNLVNILQKGPGSIYCLVREAGWLLYRQVSPQIH